jgi:Calx-beta domain
MTLTRKRLAAVLGAAIALTAAGPAAAKPADPTLILPSVWMSEADSGKAPLYVNIALDRPNPHNRPVSVIVGDFTTRPVPGSNPPRTYGDATPGQDYVAIPSFRLYWAPGQQVASFPIALLGDTLDEAAEEEIDVRFSGPDGIHIADNDIDVYIRDNDPLGTTPPGALPVPKLTNSRALEGDAGCAPHQISVHLSRPNTSGRAVSVGVHDFTTLPVPGSVPPRNYGDATPGVDYVAFAPFRLSFAPGATAATFPIRLCSDTAVEGDEHINVRIAAPDGVDIADNDLSIYLRNDD